MLEQQPRPEESGSTDGPTWPAGIGGELVPGHLRWAHLGTGPRCEAWFCWSVERATPVVVKLPRADMRSHPRALAAVRREAALLATVSHPGIVRLLHDGSQEPLPFVVTEFVEGHNVGGLLAAGETFEPEEAGLLVLQTAAAVHHLHRRGIAHLDLKPANIALRDGRPVVLDLGAGQAVGSEAPEGPRGTTGYMSPEQRRGDRIDLRMDVWALGAVLHELVTNRRPNHRRRRPTGGTGLARALDELAWSWRDPDPSARPSSALEVMAALDRALPQDIGRPWPPELGDAVLGSAAAGPTAQRRAS